MYFLECCLLVRINSCDFSEACAGSWKFSQSPDSVITAYGPCSSLYVTNSSPVWSVQVWLNQPTRSFSVFSICLWNRWFFSPSCRDVRCVLFWLIYFFKKSFHTQSKNQKTNYRMRKNIKWDTQYCWTPGHISSEIILSYN